MVKPPVRIPRRMRAVAHSTSPLSLPRNRHRLATAASLKRIKAKRHAVVVNIVYCSQRLFYDPICFLLPSSTHRPPPCALHSSSNICSTPDSSCGPTKPVHRDSLLIKPHFLTDTLEHELRCRQLGAMTRPEAAHACRTSRSFARW